MRTLRRVTLSASVIILTLLSACVTLYTAPTTGPLAKVRLKLEHDQYAVHLGVWQKGLCNKPGSGIGAIGSPKFVRREFAAEHYKPIGMLGGSPEPTTYAVEREFQAEQPVYIEMYAVLTASLRVPIVSATTCYQVIEFTPRAGEQFEITHRLSSDRCIVEVSKLQLADGRVAREPISDIKSHGKCS